MAEPAGERSGAIPPRAARGRFVVPFVFLLLAGAAPNTPNPEDWSASPEAYFLTAEERGEWKTLDSRDSRQRFIERYWLKRDPRLGSGRNEFHETVLARIKTADQRFGIEKTPGSRTARGLVFIVLGSPSRVQDQHTPRPAADSTSSRMGALSTPVATFEGNETTSTWFYDADRSRRILEVIHMPSLQIKIVVEPSRRTDSIQNPGLFDEIRGVVARASIVNPDLIPAGAPAAVLAPAAALPRQALSPAVRQILESAAAAPSLEGARASSAVLFRDSEPETFLWVFTSRPTKKTFLHAVVRDSEGREVASLTGPAESSAAFSTHSAGMVALRKVPLPAGSYVADVALTGDDEKPLAAASLPLQVPSLDSGFAVSSLILTRGPASAPAGAPSEFTFAGTALPPRADAVFTPSESLWYFVEVANPSDPSKVFLEPRLRRGGQPLAGLQPFAAKLQPLAPKRYMAGVEVPLATLEAGDYVLYLTVRDGEGEERPQAVRRGDFRIVR